VTRHVVLLTYGEPPTPAFGSQLVYSWRILLGLTRSVAPIPRPLLPLIALTRARFRWSLWSKERYGSPLEPITRAQAEGLAGTLAERSNGEDWRVHVAYEFRDPLLATVLSAIPADEPVDVVPMYAADSAFTHQLSRDAVAAWARRAAPRREPPRVLPALPASAVAAASAAHVRRELDARGVGGKGWALVLAAHGTLLDPPRPIETGREGTERIAAAIGERLSDRFDRVVLGWLNHVYGGRWTEPPVDQALRELAASGVEKVVYFPFGFLADNAESQLEGRIALRGCPGIEAVHLPCVNAAPELLEALAVQLGGDSRRPPVNGRGNPAALSGVASSLG
jgi:protoheme ferro-lyase